MALRAVPDHPKFAALKSILGVPKHVALGVLETLWHFSGRYTPQGNVGKYADSEIEAWLEWGGGETGSLIQALVDSRWVDRDSRWRLLIHDWPNHADKATKQALNRSKLEFCVPTVHTPGAHNTVLSALPVPVPEPAPVPEPGAERRAHTAHASEEIRKQAIVETIIRGLAAEQPNPQDFELGVSAAVREFLSSANPDITISTMQANLPLWWAAMREGTVRSKPMRFVIVDGDYMRQPPTKGSKTPERKRRPNYRAGEIE